MIYGSIMNDDSELKNIFQGINSNNSESEIEQKFVIPFLGILGYDHTDWQSQVVILKSKLDFLIGKPNSALIKPAYLVIEVKAPSKKITHSIWQINNYIRRTGAVFGLLTNGYDFIILYSHHGKITTILEYSQNTLISKYELIYRILSKQTYLSFTSTLYKNHHNIRVHFLNLILKSVEKESMLNLFNRGKTSPTPINQPIPDKNPGSEIQIDAKAMIITVFNNKGGVGKTTTTINLAAALNRLGKRILLIDIDAQANLTTGLGIDPLTDVEDQGKKDISHLLTEPRTTIEEIVIRKKWDDVELDIIPSHIRLSDMEATLIMTPDIDRILTKKLKKYRSEYDYILIDPPPSFGKANTISLMASSAVLIPTQLAPYPIRALEYVMNRAIAVDQSREEALPILGVAVSMYNRAATKVSEAMKNEILNILAKKDETKSVKLFPQNTWIPNLSIVANTPSKGYPLCFAEFDDSLSAKDQEAAQDAFNCYTELAKYFISSTELKEESNG
jgi:cellulose biosynthesis protein BcsQ